MTFDLIHNFNLDVQRGVLTSSAVLDSKVISRLESLAASLPMTSEKLLLAQESLQGKQTAKVVVKEPPGATGSGIL